MIARKVETDLKLFFESEKKRALLITGARQVGKTFIIREFGRKMYQQVWHLLNIDQ